MSRITNLKTVRFHVFNILDAWHANWHENYNYSSLLYEDLGIRSYFIGIFYRFKIPTSYVFLNRMSGERLVLSMDIYLVKPFKRTRLRHFFVEQGLYFRYLLKHYFYLTPYMCKYFSRMSSNLHLPKYLRKYKLDILTSQYKLYQYQFLSYGQLRYLSSFSISRKHSNKFYLKYNFGRLYNSFFLFSQLQLQPNKNVNSLQNKHFSIAFLLGDTYTRITCLLFTLFFSTSNFLWFLKSTIPSLLYKRIVYTYKKAQSLVTINGLNCLFSTLRLYRKQRNVKQIRSLCTGVISFSFFCSLYQYIKLKYSETSSKRKQRRYRKFFFFFSYWFYKSVNIQVYIQLYKLLLMFFFVLPSHHWKSGYNHLIFITHLIRIVSIYRTQLKLRLYNQSLVLLSNFRRSFSFSKYFYVIKKIHRSYYRNKSIVSPFRKVPKYFMRKHLYKQLNRIFFQYLTHKIENVLSLYTKQHVVCCFNTHVLSYQKCPPILNAKVVCDYLIYLIHTRRSIRGCFYKVRQWHVNHMQRRRLLENTYFKSQLKQKPRYYIDHLSYKKFPMSGIRIECSGNTKKGRMARKLYYGDIIRDSTLIQKSPNNTFNADIDYYQSFAITKSCTIGVKVWVFFKTHLYSTNGNFISLFFH